MPLQNRVTPPGDIVADPHRGLFTGNRGIIHDPATKTLLKKRWANPAWLICVCEFRGRRRKVMGGRSWTELFFLDEATAFAAGHRPCFYCRRDDANRFRAAWEEGNGVADCCAPTSTRSCIASASPAARNCIRCRAAGQAARWRDGAGGDGELSDRAGQPLRWTLAGYRKVEARSGTPMLITPPSTLRALASGISAGAASERELAHRPALFVDQHAGIPQRPVAHDLAAARDSASLGFGAASPVRAPSSAWQSRRRRADRQAPA